MIANTCLSCRHMRPAKTCVAFPGGIPEAIWTVKHTHVKPFPGDGGIRFSNIKAPKKKRGK